MTFRHSILQSLLALYGFGQQAPKHRREGPIEIGRPQAGRFS